MSRKRGVDYFTVRENISKDYWEQIDLKLYISLPKDLSSKAKESPFNKIVTLNNTLYDCFRFYQTPGTHLAVNKIIAWFTS